MRAARIIIAALGLGLFSPSAWAQFGAPPTASSYTLNVVLETPKGEVLYKDTLKCDPLVPCDSPLKELVVDGQPRLFRITLRWNGLQLDYECFFKINTAEERKKPMVTRANGELPLRNKQASEKLLYNTQNGVALPRTPEFAKGPIAKVKLEVRL